MRWQPIAIIAFLALIVAVHHMASRGTFAQPSSTAADPNPADAAAKNELAKHGEYIVHHVAMCTQCHTPRDEQGSLIDERLLLGAPMPVASPFPDQPWAFTAPKIAGLPGGWTENEMVQFLKSGKTPTGYNPQPPMPPFRFTDRDAQAVTAYLKSLD